MCVEIDYETVDDDGLVRRALASDEPALDALIRRHYRMALRYAGNMLGSRAAAEDAVQETFVRMCRSLPRYVPSGRFRAWLLRILVNRCRTEARRRSVRERLGGLAAQRYARVEPPALEDGFEPAVRRALERLPPTQREAVLLRFVEELSYEQIASLTGASASAVKMRVARGRRRLAQDLDRSR